MEVSYFRYSGNSNMNDKYMLKSDVEYFTKEDDQTYADLSRTTWFSSENILEMKRKKLVTVTGMG